jgi:cyclopentanol dehydrogenase
MQLRDKVILVTGAASGIGRQTCLTLAARGVRVYAADIDGDGAARTRDQILNEGGQASCFQHDVTQQQAWHDLMQSIEGEGGRLDGLVNSAGLMVVRPFQLTDYELFRRQQTVNVDSVWLGCQAALPLLARAAEVTGGSAIVNLSSILGLKGGAAHAAYCTSKGAVRLLTKALAVELGKQKVRVNSVHPGLVETPLGLGAVRDMIEHGALATSFDTAMMAVAQRTPLGRTAQPLDVANVIAFLCSDESQYMTGSELTVDGGFTVQ